MTPSRLEPLSRRALEGSIPGRFAEVVAVRRDDLAVSADDRRLTYAQLDELSGSIAAAIVASCGEREEPVALLVDQSATLVAAMLGVLRAGKAYVPLDGDLPDERLAGLLAECGPVLALAGAGHEARMRGVAPPGVPVLELARLVPACAPSLTIEPDRLAYVYYTSGSTGKPKGVTDTHRNVLHNVLRYTSGLGIDAADRLSLLQGPAFSGAVSNVFCALMNGGSVHPYDVGARGLGGIGAWLEVEAVTIYHSVPSIFRHAFAEQRELPHLRAIRLEGDRAAPRDVELFRRAAPTGCVLANGLGATECGLVRQFFLQRGEDFIDAVVPIGYPVPDMDVLVVDELGQPVAAGAVGEIVVRSRFLSPGYWRRQDLTERAFADAPGEPGVRRYRTGDLGRLRPDGCLEHLGRLDFQLKVRGQRVEVEAVEERLRASGLVEAVALATRTRPDDEVALVAYVVPSAGMSPTASALRAVLVGSVPPASVPTAFVELPELPLGPNGKVDLRALPEPSRARPLLSTAYVPPRTAREAELVELLADVLDREQVGVEDDFVELGGDSLAAAALVARLAASTGHDLHADLLLRASTVCALARELAALDGGASPPDAFVLNAAGTRVPLILLHGDYVGGGIYTRRLAALLGAEQPLFVLGTHRPGHPGEPRTVEEMALAQAAALGRLQPTGPYRIAGFAAAGGLVAYELARLLVARGERVEQVSAVATLPPNPGGRSLRRGVDAVARIARLGPERADDLYVRLRRLATEAAQTVGLFRLSRNRHVRFRDSLSRTERALPDDPGWMRALECYLPEPLAIELILVWPRDEPAPGGDPGARWQGLVASVSVVEVNGTWWTATGVHLDEVATALAGTSTPVSAPRATPA